MFRSHLRSLIHPLPGLFFFAVSFPFSKCLWTLVRASCHSLRRFFFSSSSPSSPFNLLALDMRGGFLFTFSVPSPQGSFPSLHQPAVESQTSPLAPWEILSVPFFPPSAFPPSWRRTQNIYFCGPPSILVRTIPSSAFPLHAFPFPDFASFFPARYVRAQIPRCF